MVYYNAMNFLVTYRNKAGAQEQMTLEASDRAALFAELSRRGISAVRVAEAAGKAKPRKPASPKGGKSPAVGKGLAAGLAVVLAACGVFWFLSRSTPGVPTERKDKKQSGPAESRPPDFATSFFEKRGLSQCSRGSRETSAIIYVPTPQNTLTFALSADMPPFV